MTREEILDKVLNTRKDIILELATSFGKSRMVIEKIKKEKPESILILVPKNSIKDNWKREFKKWKAVDYLSMVTFSTYQSIHKISGYFDIVCLDECHRLTDRCKEYINNIEAETFMFLSATINRELLNYIKSNYETEHIKATLSDGINTGTIPTPTFIHHKLSIDSIQGIFRFTKGAKATKVCKFKDRWSYIKSKTPVIIECNAREYLYLMDENIEYLKKRYFQTNLEAFKHKWLNASSERLKWLGSLKNGQIQSLLSSIADRRVLIFCNSIAQAEALCDNPVVSSRDDTMNNINKFNRGEINHISACNILNEGVSLTKCEIGIFASINSSEIMQIQKCGRLLRHSNPKIVLVYFENTREEEIVKSMLENYKR